MYALDGTYIAFYTSVFVMQLGQISFLRTSYASLGEFENHSTIFTDTWKWISSVMSRF